LGSRENILELWGLILFFERPIKIGDRVEIIGVVGEVREIGARATTTLRCGGNLPQPA